jgi:hypothetical protein
MSKTYSFRTSSNQDVSLRNRSGKRVVNRRNLNQQLRHAVVMSDYDDSTWVR